MISGLGKVMLGKVLLSCNFKYWYIAFIFSPGLLKFSCAQQWITKQKKHDYIKRWFCHSQPVFADQNSKETEHPRKATEFKKPLIPSLVISWLVLADRNIFANGPSYFVDNFCAKSLLFHADRMLQFILVTLKEKQS